MDEWIINIILSQILGKNTLPSYCQNKLEHWPIITLIFSENEIYPFPIYVVVKILSIWVIKGKISDFAITIVNASVKIVFGILSFS